MVNSVTIINSLEGVNAKILCYSINYNWNNLAQSFEIPGSTTIQGVQFNGWKNPGLTLNFTIDYSGTITGGYITWAEWNKIVKSSYDSTLQIVFSKNDLSFGSYGNSTVASTNIAFRVVNYQVNIDPSDNKDANLINITAQLIECKV